MLGGAIYADNIESVKIRNSTFHENLAYMGYGQNIYITGARGSLDVEDTTFTSYHNSLYFSGELLSIIGNTFEGD